MRRRRISIRPKSRAIWGASDSGAPVFGIFSREHVPVDLGEMAIVSTEPMLTCRSTDCVDIKRDSVAEVRGLSYSVVAVEPDFTGLTRLRLKAWQ